jgi:hypothetical protein
MGKILDITVVDVGDIKELLAVLPDEMPVSDADGNPLRIRIYEKDGVNVLEGSDGDPPLPRSRAEHGKILCELQAST